MNPRSTLTAFAWLAIAALVGVSTWASLQIGIGDSIVDMLANPAAGNNPWLIASLFDAYLGFLWFWAWVLVRESSWTVRLVWLALILCLGNIAMGAYALLAIRQLAPGEPVTALLQRRMA